MKKKTITLLLIAALTLTMLSLFSISNVKADASQVKILSYSWYVAPSNNVIASFPGDLVVVGEIQNTGSTNLGYVYVGASVYDSTGNFLASAGNSAFVADMLPGQKAPFYIDLTANSGATGDLSWVPSVSNVTVSAVSASDTTDSQYSGLSIVTSTSNQNNGIFTVSGTIQNAGTQTAGAVWVVATFYNVSGTVVSVDYTNSLSQSFGPGASATFTATPTDNYDQTSNPITNYSLLIQSIPLTSTPIPTPSVSSSPTPTPIITTNPTQSPMIPSNNGYLIYGIGIIIALAVVVIIVVTLLLLRKRRKTVPREAPVQPSTT